MFPNLTGIIDRVEQLLFDTTNNIYPAAAVEEGVRLALGEYNLIRSTYGQPPDTLNGLDGAITTTLPYAHDTLIVLGAAAYTVAGRQVDRAEAFDLNDALPKDLAAWAKDRYTQYQVLLKNLRDFLEQQRLADLRTAINPPYSTGWPIDQWDEQL